MGRADVREMAVKVRAKRVKSIMSKVMSVDWLKGDRTEYEAKEEKPCERQATFRVIIGLEKEGVEM